MEEYQLVDYDVGELWKSTSWQIMMWGSYGRVPVGRL